MNVLYCGTVTFFTAFLLHFFIWKIHIPRGNHTKILLYIFFGTFIAGSLIITKNPLIFMSGAAYIETFPDYLELFIFYTSLTLAYLATYSAIEVDSPSLAIVKIIADNASSGLEREEVCDILNDEILVKRRIDDLIKDKMIYLTGDNRYRITKKGLIVANIFITFRSILKAPKGG